MPDKIRFGCFAVAVSLLAVGCGNDTEVRDTRASGNMVERSLGNTLEDSGAGAPLALTGIEVNGAELVSGAVIDSPAVIFNGTAPAGATIEIWLNDQLAGATVANPDGAWTLDYASVALTPGEYRAEVRATTVAERSQSGPETFLFTYAPTQFFAPTIESLEPDTGFVGDFITNATSLALAGSGMGERTVLLFIQPSAQSVAWESLDPIASVAAGSDGRWSAPAVLTELVDGQFSLRAAVDTPDSRLFGAIRALEVDTVAPAIPVIAGFQPDTGVIGDGITAPGVIQLLGTAEAGSTVRIRQDDVLIGSTQTDPLGSWSFQGSQTLAPGDYQFTAISEDLAGNQSAETAAFPIRIESAQVDGPSGLLFSPDTGVVGDGITAATSLTISGIAPANATIAIQVDGGQAGQVTASATGQWALSLAAPLADGPHQIDAVSIVNNVSAEPLTVTIDATAPAAPTLLSVSEDSPPVGDFITADLTPQLGGSAEPNSVVTLLVDNAAVATIAVAADGTWQSSPLQLASGTYAVTATSADVAGNVSAATEQTLLILGAEPTAQLNAFDTDTGLDGDWITADATPTFTGTGSLDATVTVELSASGGDVVSLPAVSSGATGWQVTSADLADAEYSISLVVRSPGQEVRVETGEILTVDSQAPAVPTLMSAEPDTGVADDFVTATGALTFTGSAEAGATVELLLDATVIGTTTAGVDGAWQFDNTANALSAGEYQLQLRATDVAGNVSGLSVAQNLTITADSLLVPVISGLVVDSGVPADGVTNQLPLQFNGIGEPGATITLLRDGIVAGSGLASATGLWQVIDGSSALADGAYVYTATQSLASGVTSGASNPFAVTLDTQPPAVVSLNPLAGSVDIDPAAALSLGISFDEPIALNAALLTVLASDASVVGTATATANDTELAALFTGALQPGSNYSVRLDGVTDLAGNPFAGLQNLTDWTFSTAINTVSVLNVTSSLPDGDYTIGDSISVNVQFSAAVTAANGAPTLALQMQDGTEREAPLFFGNGTNEWVFAFSVGLGDASDDLAYTGIDALRLNGDVLTADDNGNVEVTLPTPGAVGSLSANKDLRIVSPDGLSIDDLPPELGVLLEGVSGNGNLGQALAAAGDINGDGRDDYVIAAPGANRVYVLFGRDSWSAGSVEAAATNGFWVNGAGIDGRFGAAVAGAGDVNGDGLNDLAIAAPGAEGGAGVVAVIYGKADGAEVVAANLNGNSGFRISGANGARLGDATFGEFSNGQGVSVSGDFNGDGLSDVAIGAPGFGAGAVFIVEGRRGNRRDVVLAEQLAGGPDASLFTGAGALGTSVLFIGDLNDDGRDELMVGAPAASRAWIIYGSANRAPVALDSAGATVALALNSPAAGEAAGVSLAAGHFIGGGVPAIAVGAPLASGIGRVNSGAVYVADVSAAIGQTTFTLGSGGVSFNMNGAANDDNLGAGLAGGVDYDGDGFDDLVAGAPSAQSLTGNFAGNAWLVLGSDDSNRGDIDLESQSPTTGFPLFGSGEGDRTGAATGLGDVNGDGLGDMWVAAPQGDNLAADAGETALIYGRDLNLLLTPGNSGSAGIDNLIGTAAADSLFGNGGADAISGGAGNDVIAVPDNSFFRIHGGAGFDSLLYGGSGEFNLTALAPERLRGVEAIALGNNGTRLVVNRAVVSRNGDVGGELRVRGGGNDQVLSSPGDAWCSVGSQVIDGISWNVFVDRELRLLVEAGVNVDAVSSFTSQRQFLFDTTGSGADVAADVENFPLLVRLSAADGIAASVRNGGPDIRFTDLDGTWLPYEIERWTGENAEIWVRVPRVDGNSNSDGIIMHYQERIAGSVSDDADPDLVWQDYLAVYHFADNGTDEMSDSSAYMHDGSAVGDGQARAAGVIGPARALDGAGLIFGVAGSDSAYRVANAAALDAMERGFTVEMWYRRAGPTFLDSRRPIISRKAGTTNGWELKSATQIVGNLLGDLLTIPGLFSAAGGGTSVDLDFPRGLDASEADWSHYTITADPTGGFDLYVDGSQEASSGQPLSRSASGVGGDLIIGGFNALMHIDELRIYRGAGSFARSRLSYENQRSGSNFLR